MLLCSSRVCVSDTIVSFFIFLIVCRGRDSLRTSGSGCCCVALVSVSNAILFFYFVLLAAGCWGDVTHCGQVNLDVAVSLSCLSLSHSMTSAPSRSPSSSRLKKKETCSCHVKRPADACKETCECLQRDLLTHVKRPANACKETCECT